MLPVGRPDLSGRTFSAGTRGFTLLEVVVAVAVLAIGMAAAMQIFSSGLKNLHRIDRAHQAISHAENVMSQILSDQSITTPAQLSGDLDPYFSYTAEIDYWDPPPERSGLQQIPVKVQLLSVVVVVHFRDDPHGKLYRTVCLKSVSTDPFSQEQGPGPDPADVLRRLFGGGPVG